MQGAIRECRYRHLGVTDSSPLYCFQETVARKGTVTYIDDSQGYHKVGNPENQVATTLHLYSPPIQRCKIWTNEVDAPQEAYMSNYSEFGCKL